MCILCFGTPVGKGSWLGHRNSFGGADKPHGVHQVWEHVYCQCKAGTRQMETEGLGRGTDDQSFTPLGNSQLGVWQAYIP